MIVDPSGYVLNLDMRFDVEWLLGIIPIPISSHIVPSPGGEG